MNRSLDYLYKTIPGCMLGLSLLVAVGAFAADGFNAGPLLDDFDLTLTPGHRTEALGGFFYSEQREDDQVWAIPPFMSHYQNKAIDAEEWDFCYPLMTYDRYGTEHRWQFIQLFSTAGGETMDGDVKKRFWLFPIYLQQRSDNPAYNYTSLFPIYGHMQNMVFRDKSYFVMWPIYIQSVKRDIVTDNYFYPFVHIRTGNGLTGWQVWPAVGHEHKDVTTRTNGFGEVETVGGHDRLFVAWPFYSKSTLDIGTTNPATELMVFPAYTQYRSPQRDVTTYVWPFFNIIDDRGRKYHEWEGPWPFVAIARGEGKTTTRVFPFFSEAHTEFLDSGFYLWPLYKYNRVHSGALDRERTRIFFYLYSDVKEKNVETGKMLRRIDFWPLFTYRKDFNDNARLQILSIADPILPNNKSVERDWSPVYALWRSEQNPSTGASSESLLWNLYRHESTPVTKKCSLLFGLFQYESDADGKRLKLFYIPVSRSGKAADQPTP